MQNNVFFNSPYCNNIKDQSTWIRVFYTYFKIISEVAQEYHCDIIDLSRTFNPNDENDYGNHPGAGKTPIEPSNKSSQYIADLADYVIQDLEGPPIKAVDFYHKSRIFYGKKGSIKQEDNTSNYPKQYINALCDHMGTKHVSIPSTINYPLIFFIACIALSTYLYYLYSSETRKDEDKKPKRSKKEKKRKATYYSDDKEKNHPRKSPLPL